MNAVTYSNMLQLPSRAQRVSTLSVRAQAPKSSSSSAPVKSSVTKELPEWMPEPVQPFFGFLMAKDFKLQDSKLYKEQLAKYLEDPRIVSCLGWKEIPEIVNGRVAMISFVAGFLAELFGAGTFLRQLSAGPQAVLLLSILIAVGSVTVVYRGVDDVKLKELRDQYTLPEGPFTEPMERFHGRVAMLGTFAWLVVEMIKGTPIV